MKSSFFLVAVAALGATPALHAQIVWSVAGPQTITGVTDVATDGSYVDALQTHLSDPTANKAVTPESVTNTDTNVSVTFGIYDSGTLDDAYFNFNGDAGYGGAGRTNTASSNYNDILDGCTFVQPGPGSFSIGSLQTGHTYELQIWDSAGWATTITDGASVSLNGDQYALGTFTYSGSPEVVDFVASSGSSYGTIDAVSLRDITAPEPATYAMLFAGVGALVLVARLRRRA